MKLLTQTFHQHWDGSDELVHPLRIVAEVLREFEASVPRVEGIDEAAYLETAYQTLLAHLGTSTRRFA